jgi:hypothetical protein
MPELVTKTDLLATQQELRASFAAFQTELNANLEILTLRLTLRFGVMWAAAIWALLIIVKLT